MVWLVLAGIESEGNEDGGYLAGECEAAATILETCLPLVLTVLLVVVFITIGFAF